LIKTFLSTGISCFVDSHSSMGAFNNIHLGLLLDSLSLFNHLGSINFTSFIADTRFIQVNIDVNNIVFMELFSPSFRDPILDLIFQLVHIGVFGESLRYRLLVKLIKLVVKLCNHLLDILSLLLLIQFVNHSLFNIFLRISRHHTSLRSNHQLSSYLLS
jgi:hypothetical protein